MNVLKTAYLRVVSRSPLPRLAQRGDTIVEVLISIAIISLILGGAYVTTHNAQLGVRNSQEHAEALKLLEDQVEQLRANAAGDGLVFSQASAFCMYSQDPVAATSSHCQISTAGTPTLSIQCSGGCPDASGGYLYTVRATWDQVSGGKANESMVYRLYQ